MEDLLQTQIKESCKLALPNGLKELMADISREVLRSQPNNLYRFITDYLAVLLVTRENLSIASHLCSELCDASCQPELDEELGNIGLQDEDVSIVKTIVMKHFQSVKVNEGSLLMKLITKTDIDEELLPAIQEAVRTAYLRHQANHVITLQSSLDEAMDEVSRAAAHTMELYRNIDTTQKDFNKMAEKNQFCTNETNGTSWDNHKISVGTISSTSLAGSYLKLPIYKPYSAHDHDAVTELEEISRKEHIYVDYTEIERKKEKVETIGSEKKTISFEEPRNIDENDSSEGSIEEIIEHGDNRSVEEHEIIEEILVINEVQYDIDSLGSLDSI